MIVKNKADIDNPTVLTGYLVDGNMNVPLSDGNRDYVSVQKWIAEGNIPEEAYTQVELDAYANSKVKQDMHNEMNELLEDMTPAEAMLLMLHYGMAKTNTSGTPVGEHLTPTGEDVVTWGDKLATKLEDKIVKLRAL